MKRIRRAVFLEGKPSPMRKVQACGQISAMICTREESWLAVRRGIAVSKISTFKPDG